MAIGPPMVNPLTMPLSEPIVAIVVLLLVHVPPLTALLIEVVRPAQIEALPVIGYTGSTVIVLPAAQPELNE
jgi:hypothetical protein